LWCFDGGVSFDVDLLFLFTGSTAFVLAGVFYVVGAADALTVVSLSNVDFCLTIRFTFDLALNVDLNVGVLVLRLLVVVVVLWSLTVDFDVDMCVSDWGLAYRCVVVGWCWLLVMVVDRCVLVMDRWTLFSVSISREFDLGEPLALWESVTLLVHADFLSAARTVFLVEVGFEGRVAIFPSDALLGSDLCLNPGVGCLLDVVAVRRREDAQRDWNSGVKVQVDECEGRG
jgi:hypothetical protein